MPRHNGRVPNVSGPTAAGPPGGRSTSNGVIWHGAAQRCSLPVVLRARSSRDRRGVAAVFLAVALVPLIGAVGLAVNSSLGYLLKTRMGKSLDTAGLAAGRVALDANAKEVAQQFFDANFGKSQRQRQGRAEFDFELDDDLSASSRSRPPPTMPTLSCGSSATTP